MGQDSKAGILLLIWYIFSAFTLFTNKYVLKSLEGDGIVLGVVQMLMTTLCGYVQLFYPLGMFEAKPRNSTSTPGFYQQMSVIGGLRFSTVLLGLIAINYVEVSFVETVKSSAPAFTVLISRVVIGEHTGLFVSLSLLPVMGGLALASLTELSVNGPGFLAALGTNVSECFQNVYSKKAISKHKIKFSPAEMQFYTSLCSFLAQVPVVLFLVSPSRIGSLSQEFWLMSILNGVFFHFQTISNFALLEYISSVTHSVANTAKRALLITFSVIIFGNHVTILSGIGTITVFVGVLCYNRAIILDKQRLKKELNLNHPLQC